MPVFEFRMWGGNVSDVVYVLPTNEEMESQTILEFILLNENHFEKTWTLLRMYA